MPNTSRSPSVASSNPAIMEISVVFPQPDGPTSMASSPMPIWISRPRSAWTCASPSPNHFVIPSHTTARSMCLSSKNHGRFKYQDFADAQQASNHDDEQDHTEGADHGLPKHEETPRCVAARDNETGRRQPHPNAIAYSANHDRPPS